MLTTDELAQAVADGSIDTVIVAFTDMQGRLMGKRLHGEFFCEEMADDHPVERYRRDARVTTLYEGTSQIQKLIIGRAATGVDAVLPFAPDQARTGA